MKKRFVVLQSLAAVLTAASTAASGQNNAIQLFAQPANVRTSTQGTNYTNQNVFNSTILSLQCPADIQAVISSSADGSGKVLVDNFITFNTGNNPAVDICSNGTVENGNQQNCFTSTYSSLASNNGLDGQNPDLYLANGGVPAIDVSSRLSSGSVQAQIGLVDTGGKLTSSTLYLVTNCTSNGVVGPGQVTGNPISSSSPTPQQLGQNFLFNGKPQYQIQFTYNLNPAHDAGTLTIPDGTTPSTGDTPIDPSAFQANYLTNTSFATANCLLHTGELFNGQPACKLFTLTCQIGSQPAQKGALCPTSQDRNEVFQEFFDGPAFPDLADHQGVGFLEAQDDWQGSPCTFDPDSSLAGALCPQNILTSFSGPGAYTSGGRGQSPNSSFITVAPVPEVVTAVTVTNPTLQPGNWVNNANITAKFVSTPPAAPGVNTFVAAPIESLTYGFSDAANVPSSDAPVAGDITLKDVTCPGTQAAIFTPPAQPINLGGDGQYLLHYMARDCAGTEELKFTKTNGSYATSFYTFPVNVDSVTPGVSGPTLSPGPSVNAGIPNSYRVGDKVMANYQCTDDRSGVVQCGAYTYSPGTTKDTGQLSTAVDTSAPGPHTYTVKVVDAAGNTTSASVNYLVVNAATVNLSILKLAPFSVKSGSQFTYGITVGNLGRNTASTVAITDVLPSGVTFVKATANQLVCSGGKCSNAASCSFATNTVTCTAPTVSFLTPVFVGITVQVQATRGTKITNKATVSSSNPEGSPGNSQSSAITTVK